MAANCEAVLSAGCSLPPPRTLNAAPLANSSEGGSSGNGSARNLTVGGPTLERTGQLGVSCAAGATDPGGYCTVERCSAGASFCVSAHRGDEAAATFVVACDSGSFPHQAYPAMAEDEEESQCAIVLPHTVIEGLTSMGGAQWKSFSAGVNFMTPLRMPPPPPPPPPSRPHAPPTPPTPPPPSQPPVTPPAGPPPAPDAPPHTPKASESPSPGVLIGAAVTVLTFVCISACICTLAIRHVRRTGRLELQKRYGRETEIYG